MPHVVSIIWRKQLSTKLYYVESAADTIREDIQRRRRPLRSRALSFWDRFGRRTVERMSLRSGMEILDVCSGMGGSALPAAEQVGPTGHVIAVDLAQNLLAKGTKRATERGLTNVEFRRADLEDLPFTDASFDAVLCVLVDHYYGFGISLSR
jgi:2-polyprenyl-3-methyl-5-hydroxy-6-metoxy-1,4-benzoquinol methylase